MIQKKINIDIFEWEVWFFFIQKSDKNINKIAKKYNMHKDDFEDINEKIKEKHYDGGVTLTYIDRGYILVFLYPFSSKKTKINLISHEIRHAVDRVVECCHIKDLETPAYLTGYLTEKALTL